MSHYWDKLFRLYLPSLLSILSIAFDCVIHLFVVEGKCVLWQRLVIMWFFAWEKFGMKEDDEVSQKAVGMEGCFLVEVVVC